MSYSLVELGLTDAPPEAAFDNLTALASDVIDAEVALVSVVDFQNDRQFFKSQIGLPEPWASRRETPLTHSFCQHVVSNDAPLIVENAPLHPLVRDNRAIPELGVISYLGVPFHLPSGRPVGALCVIGGEPRTWAAHEIELLNRCSVCVSDAIRLKIAKLVSDRLRQEHRDFTYALSHDLKSPINTLTMILDELTSEALCPGGDAASLLIDAASVTGRMGEHIEGLMSYIETIGRETAMADVDLSAMTAEILQDLSAEIRCAGAEVSVSPLPVVCGDRLQLRVVLQNLIANALKFRLGDRPLQVRVRAIDEPYAWKIDVEDNGIGIAAENCEKVFGLFSRLHVSNEYPGSGIGLALCRRVAENHSGNLSVASEAGRGSCFSLTLPKGPK
ncbi:MAG: ATP-binding protein [Pseudomonadota bacterium]